MALLGSETAQQRKEFLIRALKAASVLGGLADMPAAFILYKAARPGLALGLGFALFILFVTLVLALLRAVEASRSSLVASERRLRLLGSLGELARSAEDPEQIMPRALALLGGHLKVSRCAYAVMEPDEDSFSMPCNYTDGSPEMLGRFKITDFSADIAAQLRRGEEVVARDVKKELGPSTEGFDAAGIRAFVGCPLKRQGAIKAILTVHQSEPRDWTEEELAIIREFSEHCWSHIERRIAEEQLRRSEQRLRTIIETTPECVKVIDPNGVVLEMNRAGLGLMEADRPEQIIGQVGFPFIAPEDRESFVEYHRQACGGRPARLTYGVLGLKGGRKTVEASAAPLRMPDGSLCSLSVSHDITGQRKLEEQLRQSQKMEAVGQLAGGVAHDFNNLLTVIIGSSELLSYEKGLGSGAQELVADIRGAADRASGLTRQLLAFSRKQLLEPRVVNLNGVLTGVERLLKRLIGEHIDVSCSTLPALWPVKVDPGQIEQAIINLAVNARDAMPKGGKLSLATSNVRWGEEDVRLRPDRKPGAYVLLSVSDTGHGMSPEVRDRIFEPFFTTKEAGKGTGLGLAVVHGIIKQSEGCLDVYSEPGVGTTFKIHLPALSEGALAEKGKAAQALPVGGSESILLVEDEPAVRRLVKAVLEAAGYKVLEAANGTEALALVAKHSGPLDLLLTDLIMPETGGRKLEEQLLPARPGLKALFISGYTDDAVVRHGILDHTRQFLQKPFTSGALLGKVREVLDSPA